jgi:hypothetical protein
MERWAKVQNSQKESGGGFKKPIAPVSAAGIKKESATADAGFAAISKVVMASWLELLNLSFIYFAGEH